MKHIFIGLLSAAVALVSARAHAQDLPDGGVDGGESDSGTEFPPPCPPGRVGCHLADADWVYRDALFDGFDFDTGWVPSGSPIQLRFGLVLGGETEVGLGGTVVTSWPPGLEVMVPGREGTGYLRMNYGFELIAQLRIDVDVAGVHFDWEGDIPIPYFPEDLRLAGEVSFDPFLLPGSTPRPISVDDTTDRVRVLYYDITDSIVDIPGIGGGFLLAVQGELETAYQTERIEVDDALPIVGEGESTLVEPPPIEDPDDEGGFGASVELPVHPEGTLFYDGRILLIPELYIELLGTRIDYTIAEIPIPLVDLENDAIFDDVIVDVPLPDVDVQPARLDFGEETVGQISAQPIVFLNNGDATLVVVAVTDDGAFFPETPTLTLDPHSTERLSMRFRPEVEGDVAVMFEFATNDPDEPSVLVLLEGEGTPRPSYDAGPVDAGPEDADIVMDADIDEELEAEEGPGKSGCGCRASGSRVGLVEALLAVVGL